VFTSERLHAGRKIFSAVCFISMCNEFFAETRSDFLFEALKWELTFFVSGPFLYSFFLKSETISEFSEL